MKIDRAGRRKLWAVRIVALITGPLLGLAVTELALRTIVPTYSPITFDIFYRDSKGQLRLKADQRRRHASPEWNVLVETNAAGFRDTPEPPRPGERLVLSLGDSMSFGWGVEYKEAFPARLETLLSQSAGPPFRVIKASIPGTGTTDQLALLSELVETTPVDVVLLAFFVGNDFHDVEAGGASQYDIIDGLLVPKDASQSLSRHMRSWVKRKSYAAQLIAQQFWRLERHRTAAVPVERRAHAGLARRDPGLRDTLELHLRQGPDEKLAGGIESTLSALSEMQDVARRHGARFVLLVIPRSFQVHEEDKQRWQEAYGLRDEDWDMDRPQRLLRDWARGSGAELIDPLTALRGEAGQGRGRLYFFPDSHLNATGHAVVADRLARYFRERPVTQRVSLPTLVEQPLP